MSSTIYTTTVTASGNGRNGHIESEDGLLVLDVKIPKEMGGAGGATNPEQMFAGGYAACFHSALKHVGAEDKVDLSDSAVSITVSMGPLGNGGFGLSAEIDVHIPNVDREAAITLVERTHQVCPYSNATRGNMDVVLTVV
ncbi:organic hydroperoxide resistance protein [Mycobacterium sp. C31M]